MRKELAMISQHVSPEPCTTMEMVVVPTIEGNPNASNKEFNLRVQFRAKYTEISQERVTIIQSVELLIFLLSFNRNLPGKVCGGMLVAILDSS